MARRKRLVINSIAVLILISLLSHSTVTAMEDDQNMFKIEKYESHMIKTEKYKSDRTAASKEWQEIVSIHEIIDVKALWALSKQELLPRLALFLSSPKIGMGFHPANEEEIKLMQSQIGTDNHLVTEDDDDYTGSYGYMELEKIYLVKVTTPVSMVCYTPGKEGHKLVTLFIKNKPQLIFRNACNLYENCYLVYENHHNKNVMTDPKSDP